MVVLDENDDKLLIITKDIVRIMTYFDNYDLENNKYDTSTVRKWINSDFLAEFSENELTQIKSLSQFCCV